MVDKDNPFPTTDSDQAENEKLTKTAGRALRWILSRGSNAVIVDLSESGVDPEILADRFPNYLRATTKAEIPIVPNIQPGVSGLMVIDYATSPDRGKETTIQDYVRAGMNAGQKLDPDFKVVLMCSSLPHKEVFTDAHFPWFNGPFNINSLCMWSLKQDNGEAAVVQYKINYDSGLFEEVKTTKGF